MYKLQYFGKEKNPGFGTDWNKTGLYRLIFIFIKKGGHLIQLVDNVKRINLIPDEIKVKIKFYGKKYEEGAVS